jgi:hypothetical protein
LSIDEQQPGQPSPQPEAVTAVEDQIDRAVRSLSGVDGLPLAEHHHHFERVHGQLRAALSDIDG